MSGSGDGPWEEKVRVGYGQGSGGKRGLDDVGVLEVWHHEQKQDDKASCSQIPILLCFEL